MNLEDSFESEVTSPTALNGHCMCGGVFEIYLVHYLERRVVSGMASTFCSPTSSIAVGTCNELK